MFLSLLNDIDRTQVKIGDMTRIRFKQVPFTAFTLLFLATPVLIVSTLSPKGAQAQERQRWVSPLGLVTPLQQQDKTVQRYSVRFTEVANSCEPRKISLAKSTIEIIPAGKRSIRVNIPTIPELKGRRGKRGKFSARVKRGKTIIKGIDGKFSVAGTQASNGKIELVLIAEYYKGKTPLCTTSWNASGKQ